MTTTRRTFWQSCLGLLGLGAVGRAAEPAFRCIPLKGAVSAIRHECPDCDDGTAEAGEECGRCAPAAHAVNSITDEQLDMYEAHVKHIEEGLDCGRWSDDHLWVGPERQACADSEFGKASEHVPGWLAFSRVGHWTAENAGNHEIALGYDGRWRWTQDLGIPPR